MQAVWMHTWPGAGRGGRTGLPRGSPSPRRAAARLKPNSVLKQIFSLQTTPTPPTPPPEKTTNDNNTTKLTKQKAPTLCRATH